MQYLGQFFEKGDDDLFQIVKNLIIESILTNDFFRN